MNQIAFNRRTLLRMGGSIAAGATVAGCTNNPSSNTTEPSSSSDTTETNQTTPSTTSADEEDSQNEPADQETNTDNPARLGHLHGIYNYTGPPETSGHSHRRYEWAAVGGEWWLELDIPKALEEYYQNRFRQRNRGAFVSDPYDDLLISNISSEFERIGNMYGLSDREVVDLSMAFVQQLRYTPDEVATGFTQHTYYPVETLIDRGGDCEDTSILLAAILRDLGYGCVLIALWDEEHMALGVKGDESIPGTYYEYNGERYYYVETTGSGWTVGEMPSTVRNTQAEIQDIHSHPTVVYEWETSVSGDEIDLTVSLENVGQVLAPNILIYAEFEDQEERAYAQAEAQVSLLGSNQTATRTLTLRPPDDRILRANSMISINDAIHDIDQSEWRRPV